MKCGAAAGTSRPKNTLAEYRRFSTFLRDFAGQHLYVIAAGPDGNNLDWTRRFFERLFKDSSQFPRIHGYSPHYYCGTAGTATEYSQAQWYELLFKAQRMDDLVIQQRAALDVYDPHRRIGLCIDEWGTWHPPTPGRNPKFLWQQNTLRDALVAALTLDIFNRHADIVAMANIAQTVNVLQALILSENGKSITTPTYHVYDLYKAHQGARSIRTVIDAPEISFNYENQDKHLPALCGSASIRGTTLTFTAVNPRLNTPLPTSIRLRGDASAAIVRETLLTHESIRAHNTFEEPDFLIPSSPKVLPLSGQSFDYTFPAQSITRLEMSLV